MDKINTEIAQMVRDGTYFRDSLSWYFNKYMIRSQVFVLALCVLCCALSLGTIVVSLYELYPLSKIHYFINEVDEVDGKSYYLQNIDDIKHKDISANESLAYYLIEQYIINRQSYSLASYREKTNAEYVRHNTIKKEYHKFISEIRSGNKDSPVRRLGTNFYIEAKVDDMKLQDMQNAVVYFTTYTISKKDNKQHQVDKYKAEVRFIMSDIESYDYDKDQFLFRVLDYNLQNISTSKGRET